MKSIWTTRRRQRSAGATILGTLAGTAFSAAAGWILYSKLVVDHTMPLPGAIDAGQDNFSSDAGGRLTFYHDRSAAGRPAVLLHSINAAASAYEMRPLFEHYRRNRPVFALDLPGFGYSERGQRLYTPQLYADAIADFLRTQVRTAADVIALSLSSEFAARAAVQSPELFHSLTLISPTGLGPESEQRRIERQEQNKTGYEAYKWLSMPLWGQALFDLIATRSSIHYFLQKSFVGPVAEDLIDYAYASAHQPGALFAPFTFLSGALFTPHVRSRYYKELVVPTLILYDRDAFTSFELLPDLVNHSEWIEATRIVNTLGLPHFEKLGETTQAIDQFWASLNRPAE